MFKALFGPGGTVTDIMETIFGDDDLVRSQDPYHPANLICELCRKFYVLGWVTGTGGGTSIRHEDHIFIAPSGVQKELMKPTDMFVMDFHSKEYLRRPKELKPSACTPLFLAAFTHRNAGCCIHTHSQWAVLITLLVEREFGRGAPFEIKEIEQIKGIPAGYLKKEPEERQKPIELINGGLKDPHGGANGGLRESHGGANGGPRGPPDEIGEEEAEGERGLLSKKKEKEVRKVPYLGYYDTLRIPIIENTAHEEDLTESLEAAMHQYPNTYAVLVRRHGIYVWGDNVHKAKTQCESLDYIFQLAVRMKELGLPWV